MVGVGDDRPPYAVAVRLLLWAAENWLDLDGVATWRGVDLAALPPHRLASFVKHVMYRSADEKQTAKLDAWLYKPVPGVDDVDDPRSVWSAGNELAAFTSAMGGVRESQGA